MEGEKGDLNKPILRQKMKEEFGIILTRDFQEAVKRGELDKARAWINFISDNRHLFPEYEEIWEFWYPDRLAEIKEAEASN